MRQVCTSSGSVSNTLKQRFMFLQQENQSVKNSAEMKPMSVKYTHRLAIPNRQIKFVSTGYSIT